MCKNFERNLIKIKVGRQSGRKVVTHNSKSDLPLVIKNFRYDRNVCYLYLQKDEYRGALNNAALNSANLEQHGFQFVPELFEQRGF